MATAKESLLASLTGEVSPVESSMYRTAAGLDPDATDQEHDLFGDLPLEEPLMFTTTKAAPLPAAPVSFDNGAVPPPTLPVNNQSSLLAGSGLLQSMTINSGSSGLFDEVDQEQERLEQDERRRRELLEKQQLQQQQLQQQQLQQQQYQQQQYQQQQQFQQQQQQQLAAERARLQQEQQQRQQMQQQQQQKQGQVQQQVNFQATNYSSSGNSYTSSNINSTPLYMPHSQPQLQQPPPQQPQPQPQLPAQSSPGSFYRSHVPLPPAAAYNSNSYNGSMLHYTTTGGPVQTHTLRPSVTAGMHHAAARPPERIITKPQPVASVYGEIRVEQPMLVQSPGIFGIVNAPPHWSYQITTNLKQGTCWLVRRRFRHVVALEDRLRQDCPGAILPPRPDKHATRAIEEASSMQTAEFAIQRANELQVYLNSLAQHPILSSSTVLRLFLVLQDDLGTAWPEVSSNALTRLGAVGAGAAVKVVETSAMLHDGSVGEDNAELLALSSSEGLRMGSVTQAVPKLEGAIILLREQGESGGAVGMELSKLTKEVEASDNELSVPLQILSNGLLRSGRRTKRLAVELSAAMTTFVSQYKLCRYEKMAFHDRRQALARCQKERAKADSYAQRLLLQQRSFPTDLDRAEREAVVTDELAVDAVKECDEIGARLKSEVNRVAFQRRTEWSKSMKIIASAMKEASSERLAIWESTRESFLHAFPDYAQSEGNASAIQ